jgi:two-component system sensor histidine kinase BaeS
MSEQPRLGALGSRLARAFLVVAFGSLAVLFVGSVLPHLLARPPHTDDAVAPGWLLAATGLAVLTAILLALVLARRLTRPIDGYIDTARRFAAGDHAARPPDLGPPEFEDLARALSAAADAVERSEQARLRLTADIVHELRNPLTALQMGLEELRDGHMSADRETLSGLHRQATRLGRVVNDLAELAAAQSSGIQVVSERVDLGEIADRALSAHAGSFASAELAIVREIERGVVVVGDSDRLHQVVGNVLVNALLYCRPGDRVTVRVAADDVGGMLQVSDTGPGIPAADLPYLFDRGWRGTTVQGTHGSGLGLPIAKALMSAQGGTLEAISEPGHGVVMTLRLPLTDDAGRSQAVVG